MALLDIGKEIVKNATISVGGAKLAEAVTESLPKLKKKGKLFIKKVKEKSAAASVKADEYIKIDGTEIPSVKTMQKAKVRLDNVEGSANQAQSPENKD